MYFNGIKEKRNTAYSPDVVKPFTFCLVNGTNTNHPKLVSFLPRHMLLKLEPEDNTYFPTATCTCQLTVGSTSLLPWLSVAVSQAEMWPKPSRHSPMDKRDIVIAWT